MEPSSGGASRKLRSFLHSPLLKFLLKAGIAAALMNAFIENARKQGRKGLILTCKEHLLSYYGSFGYQNEGISQSVHGGAVWYDMRLIF